VDGFGWDDIEIQIGHTVELGRWSQKGGVRRLSLRP